MKNKISVRTTLMLLAVILSMACLIDLAAQRVIHMQSKETQSQIPSEGENQLIQETSIQSFDSGDFFENFRLQREQARLEEKEILREAMVALKEDRGAEAQVAEKVNELICIMEQERAVENILKAKGFEDVGAFVQNNLATIIVKKTALTQEEFAKVLETVIRQTGLDAESIKIIPVA